MLDDLKALWQCLSAYQGKLLKVQILIVVSVFLENISIALIGGFIALLTNISILQENIYLVYFSNFVNISNTNDLIIYLCFCLLGFLFISTLINIFSLWHIALFANKVHVELGDVLYQYYLSRSWLFHTKHHSTQLINNALIECRRISNEVISPLMQINTRVTFASFLLIWLMILEPVLTLLVFSGFAVAYLLIFKVVKYRLISHSKQISRINQQRLRSMNDTFGGIKDILLLNCQAKFNQYFERAGKQLARSQTINVVLAGAPKYFIELMGFSITILTIIYLFYQYNDLTKSLPILGVYALAGIKLLPAFQQIYYGISTLRGGIVAFNNVKSDLFNATAQKNKSNATAREQLENIKQSIQLKGVSFSYRQDKILDNININIKAKKMVGLVGHSGAGKSTLIDILLGLIQPDEGCLMVDNQIINAANMQSWHSQCSSVPQDIFISDASVMENIAFGVIKDKIDEAQVKQAIKWAWLDEVVAAMPDGMCTHLGERGVQLSGGQRQRIGIARALYHNTEVLVMDEATSALDAVTETLIMQQINDLPCRKTIVMIAHRLQTVKKCDVIYFMHQGQIVDSGTYDELLKSNADFRKIAFAT